MTQFLGILLGHFFKSKWYDTSCFENARGKLEIWKTIFLVFSNRKQGNKYVQNILFAPLG
jgi:hypothetical protein